jgi:SAM-dependent methyltransferase
MIDFKERNIVPEIIDDFNWNGKELEQNLEEIEWINKYLGGTRASAYPIWQYIQKNLQKKITIADIGCGSGDVLKKVQEASSPVKKVNLIGVDANQHIIDFAQNRHFRETEISFVKADVIGEPEMIPQADVYMMNLFLHHFDTKEIQTILVNILQKKPSLVVINDLERSKLAYTLFGLVCRINNASFVTFNDGRLSIQKGFNRHEMKNIGEMMQGYQYQLKWQWAFRWQLIIRPINEDK